MNRKLRFDLILIACVLLHAFLMACEDADVGDGDITTSEEKILLNAWPEVLAMVMTTDYESGAISTVNTATLAVQPAHHVVHSDSVCRYDPITSQIFLVSRGGSGSIAAWNWRNAGLEWAMQYSVGADTNPQDIAVVNPQKAVIPRLDQTDLLVVHPTKGTALGAIDISMFADSDGLPEAAQAISVNGTVYVTLQRINNTTWAPSEFSSVLIIDGVTNAVTAQIKLNVKNPTGKLRFSDAVDGLVLAGTGAWGALDGGIEVMGLDGTLRGILVTEAALGGDVTDAVIATPTKGYAVISVSGENGSDTHLVAFNPQTGVKGATLIVSQGYNLSNLELSRDGKLWVADRTSTNPGVRIFNVADNAEITSAPLNVGLPPSMICLVK